MSDAALALYQSIDSQRDLEELIATGEAEGMLLECKAPTDPRLSKDLRAKLSEAVSGFSIPLAE
jgi:hypothetical protein